MLQQKRKVRKNGHKEANLRYQVFDVFFALFFGYKYLHVTKDNVLETGTNSIFFFPLLAIFKTTQKYCIKLKYQLQGEKQKTKTK